jgi:hypothetical protein
LSCDDARERYRRALDAHVQAATRLREWAERYVDVAPARPLMLVGGEMETWRRYALDAERTAQEHREALERFVERAIGHVESA